MRTIKRLRSDAMEIFNAGLKAVDPYEAVGEFIDFQNGVLTANGATYDLDALDKVYVIGAGKAAAPMAEAIENTIGDYIEKGIVVVKYGHLRPLTKVEVLEASHPIPDVNGLNAADKIINLLKKTTKDDLVIFLISGGGSALLPSPAEGITLEEKQTITNLLLSCAATIDEINTIRKHISLIKGGRLARLAYPSRLLTLILSDVIGNRLDTISSGPTTGDETTYSDCEKIIDKYQIKDGVPFSILNHIEKGLLGEIDETPRLGDEIFESSQNIIVGSNIHALNSTENKAQELGYNTLLLSSFLDGETRECAKFHVSIAREILSSSNPISTPACIISGGETTVTIKGTGKGGRNQEFALAAAIEIEDQKNVIVLSGGTDGTDGPTNAAGAISDNTTIKRASGKGLNAHKALANNDSYNFFKPLNDLIITGPTLTNVMDIRLVLVDS